MSRLRAELRRGVYYALRRVVETDDGRALLAGCLDGLLRRPPSLPVGVVAHTPPYPELGRARSAPACSAARQPIFITARFRTGSTLLWNLFRHVDGVTAFYEPFNERRWFDPSSSRTRPVDPTHRYVDEYWREYMGLEELAQTYREEWTARRLWMDADSWDPGMQRYIETLIERAVGRPVLQFNHIDFRLAWIRKHFPKAKIVHLYRHPRDQWCSSLVDPSRFGTTGTVAEFRDRDYYYLRQWATDLKYQFPFLDERLVSHPYELFYYIWKLSYVHGVQQADYSLAFEHLVLDPRSELTRLFGAVALDGYNIEGLTRLIDRPSSARWMEYADDEWFSGLESRCETVLTDFAAGGPG